MKPLYKAASPPYTQKPGSSQAHQLDRAQTASQQLRDWELRLLHLRTHPLLQNRGNFGLCCLLGCASAPVPHLTQGQHLQSKPGELSARPSTGLHLTEQATHPKSLTQGYLTPQGKGCAAMPKVHLVTGCCSQAGCTALGQALPASSMRNLSSAAGNAIEGGFWSTGDHQRHQPFTLLSWHQAARVFCWSRSAAALGPTPIGPKLYPFSLTHNPVNLWLPTLPPATSCYRPSPTITTTEVRAQR